MTFTGFINIYSIDAIIHPQVISHGSCGTEPLTPSPILYYRREDTPFDSTEQVRQILKAQERTVIVDDLFWKKRVMLEAMVSSAIKAVTFMPKNTATISLVYLEKNMQGKPCGFVAPYLERKTNNSMVQFPQSFTIRSEQDILQTLLGFDDTVKGDIHNCLKLFLKDPSTTGIGLTLTEGLMTCGWIKV